MEAEDGKTGRGSGKRRYRTVSEKVQIVEETLSTQESVAVVARRRGVNANQVFQWRKLYRSGLLVQPAVDAVTDESRLLPVTVAEEGGEADGLDATTFASSAGTINIELPGHVLVSVEGSADAALVRAVLESLKR